MSGTRSVNARGQGDRLRGEIIEAATRLLARATTREAVTLRAIARETGIAAPSIYRQFSDRDAILDAVVTNTFRELAAACGAALTAAGPAPKRIRALCHAYVRFAEQHPGEYRILFERSGADLVAEPHAYPEGIELFRYFVAAFEQLPVGGGRRRNAALDAQALWLGLHGLVTVRPATPGFPWKAEKALLDRLVAIATA